MKQYYILFLILSSLAPLSAQDTSECPANLSIFAEFAKVKNYDSAYAPWLEVKTHCPDLNAATYLYGERILSHKIKTAEDKSTIIP